MTQQTIGAGSVVLDYRLIEKLGAGGYGEVWSADAPGGLKKAVKLVFGVVGDKRAERELKSLERIKDTRHPFLLSVERIEVCEDRLVIVTELADCSLKQIYRKHRRNDLPGIPRDELLVYMGDAADALDYMRESHSLQHLDIKPENLLLVGGRVKVADFGLVKQLGDVSASMMGGLTPAYASPETFDDRPSPRSDQYSLAIVYMEMLTGLLPFSGKTAAQLAKQHIMNRPNLAGLPASDHEAIERALAKEPSRRFESCRALIDELRFAGKTAEKLSAKHGIALVNVSPMAESADDDTSVADLALTQPTVFGGSNLNSTSSTQASKVDTLPVAVNPANRLKNLVANHNVRHLEPLDLPPLKATLRPTLVLGLGGAAGALIYRLRRRLVDRFGDLDLLPALDTLVIDSDVRQLTALTSAPDVARLHPRQILPAPLKRPEDYRRSARKFLNWLSRRWLYNVPRSLQTEGIRPLGRLVLVDHADSIFARLRQSIAEIRKPGNIQTTSTRSGFEFSTTTPQIVLVSSICGGAGSGMLMDILYTLRMLVADLPGADEAILSLLLYGTDRNTSSRDLAKANAYATLEELMHFHVQDGYPGESSCGLPSFRSAPLGPHDSYLLHMGDNLNDFQWNHSLEMAAEYAYQTIAGAANAALTVARRKTKTLGLARSSPLFRTVGLRRVGASTFMLADDAADACTLNLLCCWLGETPRDLPKDLRRLIKLTQAEIHKDSDALKLESHAFVAGLDLPIEKHWERVKVGIEKTIGNSLEVHAERIRVHVSGQLDQRGGTSTRSLSSFIPAINRIFQPVDDSVNADADVFEVSFHEKIQNYLNEWIASTCAAIRKEAFHRVNTPAHRIAAGHIWMQTQIKYLVDREAVAKEYVTRCNEETAAVVNRLAEYEDAGARKRTGKTIVHVADPRTLLGEYIHAKFRATLAQMLPAAINAVRSNLSAAFDTLTDMRRELRQMTMATELSPDWTDEAPVSADDLEYSSRARLIDLIKSNFSTLSRKLDVMLQEGFLNNHGGLTRILTSCIDERVELPKVIRSAARGLIHEFLKRSKNGDPFSELFCPEKREAMKHQIKALLDQSTPIPLAWGGAKRVFGFVSSLDHEKDLLKILRDDLGEKSTTICHTEGESFICVEGEQLPLHEIAAGIIDDQSEITDIARRLHSRNDVDWMSLREMEPANG